MLNFRIILPIEVTRDHLSFKYSPITLIHLHRSFFSSASMARTEFVNYKPFTVFTDANLFERPAL